ncbi:MAG: hypothetical protein M0033_08810 [Nitrospiraceae bacterium]|nr:hypothetical protein [Nitrospiraceae bacterium]
MKPSKPFLISRLSLGLFLLALLVCSCAPVRPRMPEYPGSVNMFLDASRQKYDSMKGAFEFTFEKMDGRKVSAEAVTVITPDSVNVRVYRMGLPVGDLESLSGRKRLDYIVYEEALRKALLWWDFSRYETRRLPDAVLVTGKDTELVLAPRTYVPVRQTIRVRGADLLISYSDYRPVDGFWYPFGIRIEYRGNTLDLAASEIELRHN